jgi:hypothetical protein
MSTSLAVLLAVGAWAAVVLFVLALCAVAAGARSRGAQRSGPSSPALG